MDRSLPAAPVTAAARARALVGAGELRVCSACSQSKPLRAFSRKQLTRPSAKCKSCVEDALKAEQLAIDAQTRLKRCVQCFQDRPKTSFSKRQAQLLDGKCAACVQQLERAAAASSTLVASKWTFDCYYRVCHRGKSGGVAVRFKNNIASPVLGHVPLGRVFRATTPIYNEQGDPMVRLETPQLPSAVVRDEDKAEDGVERHLKEAWVPCRSIRNEVLLEPHRGPFLASQTSRFFRCVIEGCKVRATADLTISELGYVLYGDVVEVVEAVVAPDGVVFLRLHDRYFDGPAWVVERSLDNESVLNEVEGSWSLSSAPDSKLETYRCVQDSGAPVRTQPELTAPPVGRIPCGALVSVVQRIVTPQRQIFLRIVDTGASNASDESKAEEQWVIETSTCCASVMTKVLSSEEADLV